MPIFYSGFLRYTGAAALLLTVLFATEARASDDRPFELRLQRQFSKYVPREYSFTADRGARIYNVYYDLQQNNVESLPLQFAWLLNADWRIEFGFDEVKLTDARYWQSFPVNNNFFFAQTFLPDISRRTAQFEMYYYFGTPGGTRFGLGGGARALGTRSESGTINFHFRDKITAVGPQIGFRFTQPLSESFSFFANLDLFYMRGKRDYRRAVATQINFIAWEWGSGGTRAEYFGFDIDLGLSWRLTEGLSLDLGYRHEKSDFRFKNYFVHQLPFSGQVSDQITNGLSNGFSEDSIRGLYAGIRARF